MQTSSQLRLLSWGPSVGRGSLTVLVQIRSIQDTEKEEVTDAGRGHLVRHDLDYDVHILDTVVRESRPLSSLWHSESESINI
jgi:hypothetical protein